ncbi:MAG: YegS/Rv2252/BmrU family lipid kinase [Coleofasciculus sp. B1-GNL1-01]|uniref:YegS/Rv2252/BmrU family lipid kinase n=1 Tax=Coleofasciculus sp. B1-GNL1-01 TaxID=3068484 RepID=UPI003304F3FA
MTRSACLIFNPVAGQSDPDEDLNKIVNILEPEIELDVQCTTPEKDAAQLTKTAVERGVKTIIASGGDGTLSAAAGALVETGIPLGIIPRGTANAIASALGIHDTIKAACQTILDGKIKKIDVGRCNDKPMVLLAGIGFEAKTVEEADRELKNNFGMLAYVVSGLQKLGELEPFEATIETDENTVTITATAVTIANAAPPTSILAQGPAGIVYDDGLLDLTVVTPKNQTNAIAASYELLQSAIFGESADHEDVKYIRTRYVKVTAKPAQKIVLDGEIIGETPIKVDCIPGGLTVFVPMQQD